MGANMLLLQLLLVVVSLKVLKVVQANTISPTISLQELCLFSEDGSEEECVVNESTIQNKGSPYFSQIEKLVENHTFIFPNNTNYVKITCTAPYTVTWMHSQDLWISRMTNLLFFALSEEEISYKRIATNISDPTTFQYSSTLKAKPYRDMGEYLCQKVNESRIPEESTRVVLLLDASPVEHFSPPLNEKNITVWTKEREDGSVLLPCYVPSPEIKVALLKMISEDNWETVQISKGVTFVPEIGFLQEPSANLLLPGIYKCSCGNESVIITLIPGERPLPAPITQIVSSPAKFTIDVNETTESVVVTCCSNSQKPPLMKGIICFNKPSCDKYLKYSPDLDIAAANIVDRESPPEGNCVKSSEILLTTQPLSIRCVGDGINIQKMLLSPMYTTNLDYFRNVTMQPFSAWEDVDSSLLMDFQQSANIVGTALEEDGKLIVYDQQTLTLFCYTATWFFAEGAQVAINYTNGSSIQNDILQEPYGSNLNALYAMFQTVVTKDMKSVACYVPVFNSTKWAVKSVELNVKDPQPLEIVGGNETAKVDWKVNETGRTLQVEVVGSPLPSNWLWSINKNVTVGYTSYYMHHTPTATFVLTVENVTLQGSGDYTLEASNEFGSVSKTFLVSVEQ